MSQIIEALLEQERPVFEAVAYNNYLLQRGNGIVNDVQGEPHTPEQLMWREPDGSYGVRQFNAAWWAWKARAMYQHVYSASVPMGVPQ